MGLTAAALSRFRTVAKAAATEVFSERLSAYGEIVVLVTGNLRVLVSDGDYTRALEAGGLIDEGLVRGKFLPGELPSVPALGSVAQFQGRSYRVHRVRIVPGGEYGEIDLTPARR